MKILLVDDENVIRRALFMGLRVKGHTLVETKYPLEALKKMKEEHFDLIVVDYKMSLLSGNDLIKILQSRQNKTPALILSSVRPQEINTSGINIAEDQILSKDNSISEIIHKIENYCSV